ARGLLRRVTPPVGAGPSRPGACEEKSCNASPNRGAGPCQRQCLSAASKIATRPSAKKIAAKTPRSQAQAKPAQNSDRTASETRSRVVLASVPVHGWKDQRIKGVAKKLRRGTGSHADDPARVTVSA